MIDTGVDIPKFLDRDGRFYGSLPAPGGEQQGHRPRYWVAHHYQAIWRKRPPIATADGARGSLIGAKARKHRVAALASRIYYTADKECGVEATFLNRRQREGVTTHPPTAVCTR